MEIFFNVLRVTLEEGFMYAVLALGVYITYSILDFPDLSVDGTVPLGAVTTGILIVQGVNPWLCWRGCGCRLARSEATRAAPLRSCGWRFR